MRPITAVIYISEVSVMYNNNGGRKVTYTNVSIPDDLLEKVEQVVSGSRFGYRNRSEFIIEAVREKVQQLSKIKEVQA